MVQKLGTSTGKQRTAYNSLLLEDSRFCLALLLSKARRNEMTCLKLVEEVHFIRNLLMIQQLLNTSSSKSSKTMYECSSIELYR